MKPTANIMLNVEVQKAFPELEQNKDVHFHYIYLILEQKSQPDQYGKRKKQKASKLGKRKSNCPSLPKTLFYSQRKLKSPPKKNIQLINSVKLYDTKSTFKINSIPIHQKKILAKKEIKKSYVIHKSCKQKSKIPINTFNQKGKIHL